jgi:bifunctional non-homologous end joining protein LigD
LSNRRDRPYRAGRSPDWVKVKNPQHPSVQRVKEAFT